MKFTVAICTWNRAELLRQTLKSFCELRPGRDDWELVVVNNKCTDDTELVCHAFASQLPLRMIRENQQGHSVSRNRAILDAKGQYVVWTDDDVLVDPGLLGAYESAISAYPNAAFFGGKIIPKFEIKPARWITENREICSGVFAERDLGNSRFECTKQKLPFGANLVIRRDIQQKFLFRSEFGREANTVRGFDEIDVLQRLLDDGQRGYWIPEAHVEHFIPASRMTLDYFARYFHGQGETWITRGVTIPDRKQLQYQIRKQNWNYRLSSWRSSKIWFPKFVVLHNLRGQFDKL